MTNPRGDSDGCNPGGDAAVGESKNRHGVDSERKGWEGMRRDAKGRVG